MKTKKQAPRLAAPVVKGSRITILLNRALAQSRGYEGETSSQKQQRARFGRVVGAGNIVRVGQDEFGRGARGIRRVAVRRGALNTRDTFHLFVQGDGSRAGEVRIHQVARAIGAARAGAGGIVHNRVVKAALGDRAPACSQIDAALRVGGAVRIQRRVALAGCAGATDRARSLSLIENECVVESRVRGEVVGCTNVVGVVAIRARTLRQSDRTGLGIDCRYAQVHEGSATRQTSRVKAILVKR